MSCILAISHDDQVTMGCDSLTCTSSGAKRELVESKVVRWGPCLIGIAGRFEVRFAIASIDYPPTRDDAERHFGPQWVHDNLILPIRAWLKQHGYSIGKNGEDDGGYADELLVAFEDRIIRAYTDGAVSEYVGDIVGIGSGSTEAESFADGALYAAATHDFDDHDYRRLIRAAIEHAATRDVGVGGLTHIFSTSDAPDADPDDAQRRGSAPATPPDFFDAGVLAQPETADINFTPPEVGSPMLVRELSNSDFTRRVTEAGCTLPPADLTAFLVSMRERLADTPIDRAIEQMRDLRPAAFDTPAPQPTEATQ